MAKYTCESRDTQYIYAWCSKCNWTYYISQEEDTEHNRRNKTHKAAHTHTNKTGHETLIDLSNLIRIQKWTPPA